MHCYGILADLKTTLKIFENCSNVFEHLFEMKAFWSNF